MSNKAISAQAEILDRTVTYSISEVCERCGVTTEFVVELVEHGVISPLSRQPAEQWIFDTRSLTRLHRAQRLHRDLKINFPGLALSLELLDTMQQLRRRADSLDQQLRQLLEDES